MHFGFTGQKGKRGQGKRDGRESRTNRLLFKIVPRAVEGGREDRICAEWEQ